MFHNLAAGAARISFHSNQTYRKPRTSVLGNTYTITATPTIFIVAIAQLYRSTRSRNDKRLALSIHPSSDATKPVDFRPKPPSPCLSLSCLHLVVCYAHNKYRVRRLEGQDCTDYTFRDHWFDHALRHGSRIIHCLYNAEKKEETSAKAYLDLIDELAQFWQTGKILEAVEMIADIRPYTMLRKTDDKLLRFIENNMTMLSNSLAETKYDLIIRNISTRVKIAEALKQIKEGYLTNQGLIVLCAFYNIKGLLEFGLDAVLVNHSNPIEKGSRAIQWLLTDLAKCSSDLENCKSIEASKCLYRSDENLRELNSEYIHLLSWLRNRLHYIAFGFLSEETETVCRELSGIIQDLLYSINANDRNRILELLLDNQ